MLTFQEPLIMSNYFVLFQHPLFGESESTVMAERRWVHGKGSETTDLIPANHYFYIHLLYRSQMLKASPIEICHLIFSQLLAKSWTTGQNRVSVPGHPGDRALDHVEPVSHLLLALGLNVVQAAADPTGPQCGNALCK